MKNIQKEKYDAIIIGFGKGGKTLAADFADRGWNVAMIERSAAMYGGTCINVGCIPTKALIHLSEISEYRRPSAFSEQVEEYRQAVAKKNEITSFLRKKNFDNLDQRYNVTVYTGTASFLSPTRIQIKAGSEIQEIESGRIFINTGSSTVIPGIGGVNTSKRVYTSTSIMELDILPAHLVIIGGGYIGLEFASMYAGFGSKVTVLETAPRLIPREDEDIARVVRDTLEKKGIAFHTEISVRTIEDKETETIVTYFNNRDGSVVNLPADAVLLATGRKPNTDGLNLEGIGVKLTERGAVEVDDHLHSSVPGIWAMGDVKGGLQFTFISLDDSRIVKDELFGRGLRNTSDRDPVAYSVFIDPPLSRIGLSEEDAIRGGWKIKVAKLPAVAIPRARTLGKTDGLLKLIVNAETDLILGCTLFCADSSEIINTVALSMRAGQNYTFLRDAIFTHPSMSEALNDLFSLIK